MNFGSTAANRRRPGGRLHADRCRLAPAAVLALLSLLLALPAPEAMASAASGSSKPEEAPRVDAYSAMRAYAAARRWVQAGEVEQSPEPIWVADVKGVRLDLRYAGIPVGVHTGYGEQWIDAEAGVVDLAAVVKRAAAEAIARMRARHERAGPLSEQRFKEIGQQMLVDLQIARTPTPIILRPGDALTEVYNHWAFGYHGLHMRRSVLNGERSATVWPATALATNMAPRSQLRRLFESVGVEAATDPAMLKAMSGLTEPGGPTLSRFEVVHIAQAGRAQQPAILVRGHSARMLGVDDISPATLASIAQRLTEHLINRQRADGAMSGTYHPSTDQPDPEVAALEDTALAVYALARYAESGRAAADADVERSPPAEAAQRAADAGFIALARSLTTGQSRSIVAESLALLTIAQNQPIGVNRKPLRNVLIDRLLPSIAESGVVADPDDAQGRRSIGASTQALLFAAMAATYEQTRDAQMRQIVDRLRTRSWAMWLGGDQNAGLAMMPWLAMAELTMQRVDEAESSTGSGEGQPDDPDARTAARNHVRRTASAMLELVNELRRRQVNQPPRLGPADVLGGFQFGALPPPSAPPNPDWRTAHALAFMSILLKDASVLPPERTPAAVASCAGAARFIAQLMFDEADCFYVQSRSDTVGGVRSTLWDNRLSVGPTSMALLAVTELREAMADMR